jgi:hypothetical protein
MRGGKMKKYCKDCCKKVETRVEENIRVCVECGYGMYLVKKTQTKEEKIFFKMIDKYNDIKDYRSHYIDLGKGKVMIISWNNSWSYSIHKLESLEAK